jgi:hypothetical protein
MLYLPLASLFLTCFVTIFIAASVLKPFNRLKLDQREAEQIAESPFFFFNAHGNNRTQFAKQMEISMSDRNAFKEHVISDMYYIGKVLGAKYAQIGTCYNVFLIGLSITLLLTISVVVFQF